VKGDLTDLVDGRADVRVTGDRNTRIEGRERHAVEGASDLTFDDEVTVRVGGSVATVIGQHDARRSCVLHVEGVSQLSSTQTTQVSSESEIVLTCGKSSIRLTPDRIELSAPTIVLEASGGGASFGGGQAKLHATQSAAVTSEGASQLSSSAAAVIVDAEVKIAGPLVPIDPASALEAMNQGKKTTTIVLVDDEGSPLPFERYRIIQEHGAILGGVSDKDGKAAVDLKASAFIEFPDLSKVEKIR
jgi:hypothetical protein